MMQPSSRLLARAPVRICDCGGWTDTWFAGHGRVCHIAVWPGVDVELVAHPRRTDGPRVRIATARGTADLRGHIGPPWGPHPIVEAALAQLPPPEGLEIALTVCSEIPAGASTGTSAAVAVAVLAAVDALHGSTRSPRELAALAHGAEVVQLGQQCGIQDQLAAAFGGINEIAIDGYPDARVIPIAAGEDVVTALEERLLLVYLGRAHDSSSVHQAVIDRLSAQDASVEEPALDALREAAADAAQAIRAGDFVALGRAMQANTAAQRALGPALVASDAERVIDLAASAGALGWKVNGAGGDGGSLTLLCADRRAAFALARTVGTMAPGWRVIPVHIARAGVSVTRA